MADRDRGWLVVGVDPAPSKQTVAFDGRQFHAWAPADVRRELGELISDRDRVLVLWDAPLRMDGGGNFYSRHVDDGAKRRINDWKLRLAPKAVGVAPAAGCPHNILSMHVLGRPMGEPKLGLRLLTASELLRRPGRYVAEVHPAVAMGDWFARSRGFTDIGHGRLLVGKELALGEKPVGDQRMPVYKGRQYASRWIARCLLTLGAVRAVSRPYGDLLDAWEACRRERNRRGSRGNEARLGGFGDDALDAWVAWVLGRLLLDGQAFLWDGDNDGGGPPAPGHGTYVMPTGGIG